MAADDVRVVPPFECLWLEEHAHAFRDGRGCVCFEALGPNDATLLLTPHRGSRLLQHLAVSEGTAAPGYTVILGSHQNGSFKIERNGIDRFFAPHKGCRLDPGGGFRAFWLAFDNGRIAVGVGSGPLGRGARLHAGARAGGGEPAVAAALAAPEPARTSGPPGARGGEGAPDAGGGGAPGPQFAPLSRRRSASSPDALEALSPGPSLSSSPTAAAPAPLAPALPGPAPRAPADYSPQDVFDDSDAENFPADLEDEVAGEFDDVALALDAAAGRCWVARDEATLSGDRVREGATSSQEDAGRSRKSPVDGAPRDGGGADVVGDDTGAANVSPGDAPDGVPAGIAEPPPRAPPLPPLPPPSLPPAAFTLRAPSSSAPASARRAPLPAGLAHAWVDPSPVPGVRLVALSTWDAHVAYRRVRSFRGAELDAALESCRRTWDLLERVGEDRLVGAQHGERWRHDAASRPGPGQGRDAPRAPRGGAGPGPGTGPPSGRETPSRWGAPGLALPSPTHPPAFGTHATSPLHGAGARGPLSPSPGPLWARRSPSPRGGGASPALGGSPPGSPPPGAAGGSGGWMPGGWSRASSSGAASPGGAPLWAWRGGNEWGFATPPALALASPRPPSRGLPRAGSYAALLAGASAGEWGASWGAPGRGGGRGARASAPSSDERGAWEERDAADRLSLRSNLPDGAALAALGDGGVNAAGGGVGDVGGGGDGGGVGDVGGGGDDGGGRGDSAVAPARPSAVEGAEPLRSGEESPGVAAAERAIGPSGAATPSSPVSAEPARAIPSPLPPSPGTAAAAFAPALFSASPLPSSRPLFVSPRPAASPTLASARGRPSRPRADSRRRSRAPPPLFFLAFRAALSAVELSPQDTLYSLLASDLLGPAGPKLRERAARAAAARPGELAHAALGRSGRGREGAEAVREKGEGEGEGEGAGRVGNLFSSDVAAVDVPLRPSSSSPAPSPLPSAAPAPVPCSPLPSTAPAPLPCSPLLAALGAGPMALVLGDLDSRAPERDFLRLLEAWAVSRARELGISIWRRAEAADTDGPPPRAPSHVLSSPPPLFFLRQLWRLLLLVRFPLLSRAELRRARESPLAAICPGFVGALVREAEDADGAEVGARVAKGSTANDARPARQRVESGAGGVSEDAAISGTPEASWGAAAADVPDAAWIAGIAERASLFPSARSAPASASSARATSDLSLASSTLQASLSTPSSARPPSVALTAALPASGPLPLWRRRATPRRGPGSIPLPFLHCHDGGGVLGYIGSAGRTRVWVNPVVAGAVGAWASSPASRGCDPRALAGRAALVRNVAAPGPGDSPAFWAIDLGAGRSLAVSRYALRADKSGEAPTAWVLQGCVGDGRKARADRQDGSEEEDEGEEEDEEDAEEAAGEKKEAEGGRGGGRKGEATSGAGPLSSVPFSAPSSGRAASGIPVAPSVASASPAQPPQPRWVTLARVSSDASLRASPGAARSWAVPPRAASRRFRSFRVVLPRDPPRDARGKAVTHLALSGLELYGALYVDGGEGGGVE